MRCYNSWASCVVSFCFYHHFLSPHCSNLSSNCCSPPSLQMSPDSPSVPSVLLTCAPAHLSPFLNTGSKRVWASLLFFFVLYVYGALNQPVCSEFVFEPFNLLFWDRRSVTLKLMRRTQTVKVRWFTWLMDRGKIAQSKTHSGNVIQLLFS